MNWEAITAAFLLGAIVSAALFMQAASMLAQALRRAEARSRRASIFARSIWSAYHAALNKWAAKNKRLREALDRAKAINRDQAAAIDELLQKAMRE